MYPCKRGFRGAGHVVARRGLAAGGRAAGPAPHHGPAAAAQDLARCTSVRDCLAFIITRGLASAIN